MSITILNLGREGVNVTKKPVAMKDGELRSAQNAELKLDQAAGCLTKRRGIDTITSSALAGQVLAAIAGGLFFPPDLDPDTLTPQTIGGGASEFGPAALNVMRAKGYLSAATTAVANNTEVPVEFDAEAFDVGNLHDLVTDPELFTVPAGGDGVYVVVAQAKWAADADGVRSTRIYVNGALAAQNDIHAGTTDLTTVQASAVLTLVAGDEVEMRVFHVAGASLNLQGSDENETFFVICRLLAATTTTLPRCQALATSNLSCATGVATVVPLDAETFDTHAMHDNVTNNSRITVAAAQGGFYAIVGHFAWAATMVGAFLVELLKNGTTVVGEERGAGDNLVTSDRTGQVVATETLEPGDYIELRVTQNTAGAHNLLGGAVLNRTKLTLSRIG